MPRHQVDSNTLRAELRALPRGSLLLIAERAIELVTQDQLDALLGDIVQINVDPTNVDFTDATPDAPATVAVPSLLDEVRAFQDAAMNREFYEHVEIGGKGRPGQSRGTDAFIAEFDRLLRKCVCTLEADTEPGVSDRLAHEVRDCFELLFVLLRHIDEGNDDVVFFADDGSSRDVGVNWRVVLPAYFECLANTEASSPKEFSRAVCQVIAEFAEHDRLRYMDTARTVANDSQRIAMRNK